MEIEGKVGKCRCRGRKTWMECVRGDMKDLNLSMEDVVDRDVWRRKLFVIRLSRACVETTDVKV